MGRLANAWRALREDPQEHVDAQTVFDVVRALTNTVQQLEFEWAEVLDKINRWAARDRARTRRDAAAALSGRSAPTENGEEPEEPDSQGIESSAAARKSALRRRYYGTGK